MEKARKGVREKWKNEQDDFNEGINTFELSAQK